jgi:alanyl-tRNA synthetase
MISRQELIKKYISFFKKKGHKEVPSSPLIPSNDPTVLFTTAGMHPLVPYLQGQKHPLGKKLVGVQKCIRTQDIEEIGDGTHHTFFEMLGNWSLGDYGKEEAINYSFEFLNKELKIPIEKIAVSVFEGDNTAPRDSESAELWEKKGIPKERIAFLPKANNWWGPAGQTGPCGPDTEMFYWRSKNKPPKKFDPSDENWVEIWNDVFMTYEKTNRGEYQLAKQKNVDTGMGVERVLAVLNDKEENYLTDAFDYLIKKIEEKSKKPYEKNEREMRIIADHLRAATFIISELIKPSNVGQGYVARRLIRRAIRYWKKIALKEEKIASDLAKLVIRNYPDYMELKDQESFILTEIEAEEERFIKTLDAGLIAFKKITSGIGESKRITGEQSFLLFQSYGFPIEMTKELARENGLRMDRADFDEEMRKHQELSKKASGGAFKSGLADNSVQTTKLHTATHLLNEALRKIIGSEIKQRGSNITSERLRFDFSCQRKITPEELKKVENLVNEKIKERLMVIREEKSHLESIKEGAEAEFGHKYPDRVSVYTILDKKDSRGWFSKEICTGPHVSNTGELGKFKILKEESVSAGIRRIKAIVGE